MKKKLSLIILSLLMVFMIAGCACKPEWLEVSYKEPKTCSAYGETRGEPVGHNWSEATCEEPQTCSLCGQIEGDALGHSWMEATYLAPKTCSVCAATEGKKRELLYVLSAGSYKTFGIKSDGTVLAAGNNDDGDCNVDDWTDIVQISAGSRHTVGLKSDGTVVATQMKNKPSSFQIDFGQCNVDEWTDIVEIATGYCHTVGLKSDGTVVATVITPLLDTEYVIDYTQIPEHYDFGQSDVTHWKLIVN